MALIPSYKVDKIRNGTVIDHIPHGKALKAIYLLGLDKETDRVITVGINLESKKFGYKDVIKIENKELSSEEVNKIALLATTATLNIIEDYEIVKKMKVTVPQVITGIIRCSNPRCITNHEEVKTRFYLKNEEPLKIQCHYCERSMESEEALP